MTSNIRNILVFFKQNLILLLVLIITCIFPQCRKDFIPDSEVTHVHRGYDNNHINCWIEISDWSSLMSDSSLTIEEIPQIPPVDSNYIKWLNTKENRIVIRSLTSENFSDLQCLKQYIGNRTLVQLGESSHGTKEYNKIRVRIIKFLHEQMGFDVIAFESNLFECFYTNENIQQLTEIAAMKNSIFYGVWGTSEVKELFTYIKSTYNTNRPLILAGFDCQFSSSYDSELQHPSYLYDAVSKIDSSLAAQYRAFDTLTIQKMSSWDIAYLTQNRDSIILKYYEIVTFIDAHINELNTAFLQKPEIPKLLRQSILSIVAQIDFMLAYQSQYLSGNSEFYVIRDSAMASNVSFLKEKLYSDKKIIIWAHNYHIANNSYMHALYPDIKVMGNWLHERYRDDKYSIGLYMLRGKTKTDWDWSIMNVQLPVSSNSLEAILYQARKKYLFIDLLNKGYCTGNKWMFNHISAKTSGFANESMIIRDVYDGIIFIDSSSVPVYLP